MSRLISDLLEAADDERKRRLEEDLCDLCGDPVGLASPIFCLQYATDFRDLCECKHHRFFAHLPCAQGYSKTRKRKIYLNGSIIYENGLRVYA